MRERVKGPQRAAGVNVLVEGASTFIMNDELLRKIKGFKQHALIVYQVPLQRLGASASG